MKKILLFAPLILPIPAIGGGAVETLITGLINQNEIYHKADFILISRYDSRINPDKYNYTKFYLFDEYSIHYDKDFYHNEYKKYCNRIKIKRRFLKNRISKQFYKKTVKLMSEFQFQIYLIAKHEKVDIVINEGNWDSRTCLPFIKLIGKKNIYYHLHYARDEIKEFRKELPNSISISKYVSRKWAIDKNIKGNNLVLYNGIDLERFEKQITQKEKQKLLDKLNLNENDFVVIFCGRIIPEKGIEQLLNAFENITDPSIKLLLIGSVGFSTNIQTDFSNRMINKANRMKNVLYLGYISNEALHHFYQISHLQVIPSIWQEGAGLVCIEGMASGLPLIVTKSGGMIEYVDEACSIQIPINENLSDNLTKEIVSLSKDTTRRELMSNAGKERSKQFSIEKYYNDFIDLFN